jgi:expansin (peptidoglycan-binding protein)
MAKVISVVVVAMAAAVLATTTMVSPAMGDSGTATFYTPPYTRMHTTYDQLTDSICHSITAHAHAHVVNNLTTTMHAASACFGNAEEGTMIAAASEAFWDGGAACGDSYAVSCTGATNQGVPHPCTGRTVTVRIVDLCPAGCRGTIDLSQEAFAAIADPDAGKILIEYNR